MQVDNESSKNSQLTEALKQKQLTNLGPFLPQELNTEQKPSSNKFHTSTKEINSPISNIKTPCKRPVPPKFSQNVNKLPFYEGGPKSPGIPAGITQQLVKQFNLESQHNLVNLEKKKAQSSEHRCSVWVVSATPVIL